MELSFWDDWRSWVQWVLAWLKVQRESWIFYTIRNKAWIPIRPFSFFNLDNQRLGVFLSVLRLASGNCSFPTYILTYSFACSWRSSTESICSQLDSCRYSEKPPAHEKLNPFWKDKRPDWFHDSLWDVAEACEIVFNCLTILQIGVYNQYFIRSSDRAKSVLYDDEHRVCTDSFIGLHCSKLETTYLTHNYEWLRFILSSGWSDLLVPAEPLQIVVPDNASAVTSNKSTLVRGVGALSCCLR